MISKCMDAMKKNDADIVYGGLQCFGEKDDIWTGSTFSKNNILYKNHLPQSSFYKKKVWKKVDGYKQNMKEGYEDWEFWINAYKNDFVFYYLPEILYYYRIKQVSRETNAKTKHTYLFSTIVMNHPELYTMDQVQKAIGLIKKTESLSDLYFYAPKDLSVNKKDFSKTINQYLSYEKLQERQFVYMPGIDKRVGLFALDTIKNLKQLRQLHKEAEEDLILFYAPLRYEVPSLLNLDFAWNNNKGITGVHGTIFTYVFKPKIENCKSQLVAHKRLMKYLDKKSYIAIKSKDRIIEKCNNKNEEILNGIYNLIRFPIAKEPINKYRAYKTLLHLYFKMK